MMKRLSVAIAFGLGLLLVLVPAWLGQFSFAQSPTQPGSSLLPADPPTMTIASSRPTPEEEGDGDKTSFKPFEQVIKDTEKLEGLFTLYRHKQTGKLFLEVQPDQLNRNFLSTITLESGLGENGFYRGMPLGDFLFTFRRVNNSLQFVVPNVYFRAQPGQPVQRSVKQSFSDSVLDALPIKSIHPQRHSFLVELGPLMLGDLPGLTPMLSSVLRSTYTLDANTSYFGQIQAFPLNVELESIYGFSGGTGEPAASISSLPDSRAFSLHVRYSLSQLPEKNGYRPRLADDRVGYFITAYQDFSDDAPREPFVRYINRWHLEKQNPQADLSLPKKPIVFWIENTVPLEYRDAIREGVLMWNRAFEKIGFKNAVEVHQMPDNATWDPADTRYNTIRWFNSLDAIFAMGPSRVNPLTGEILDADVIVDSNFVRALKQEYRSVIEQHQMQAVPVLAKMMGAPNLCSYGMAADYLQQKAEQEIAQKPAPRLRFQSQMLQQQDLCYGLEAARQFSVGSLSLSLMQNVLPNGDEMKDYVHQFVRELIAHEIGHTLGLRHNFRGSAMLKPQDLNNTTLTHEKGLVGSVMDYNGVNLAPQGVPQGDYFTAVVGPYDEWAIAYGYKPSDAIVPQAERRFLDEIARRAPNPDLAYATDEDVFSALDPKVNVYDLSDDLLTYAQWQMDNARAMWKRIDRRYPTQGESYNEVRVAFNAVFDYYFQYARFLTHYIGGEFFNRYRGGDATGRLPFEAVPVEKQRQALSLLVNNVFNDEMFTFSPEFVNKLAPSRWSHWGADPPIFSLDYPIHDRILFLQAATLTQLFAPDRLNRLRDGDLKNGDGQTLGLPELFDTLQTAIWREVVQREGDQPLRIGSLRRDMQRVYMNQLITMVLRQAKVPEDARTIAWYELRQLKKSLDRAIGRVAKNDLYTRAHLEESRDRIAKALDAQLQSS